MKAVLLALLALGLVTLLTFGLVRGGFHVYDTWDMNREQERPTVQNSFVGDSEWTKVKQYVYEGCVGEAGGFEAYCSCAADHMVDTYGGQTIAKWGHNNYIPSEAINEVLDKCL